MKILLIGCATRLSSPKSGFIASHTLERLLAEGHEVVGVDNFDPLQSGEVWGKHDKLD